MPEDAALSSPARGCIASSPAPSIGTTTESAAVVPGGLAAAPLHAPVHGRSTALVVIAVIGGLFALRWAKDIVVPVLFGMMMSYALSPTVDLLERARLPRPLGAGFLLMAIALAMGAGAGALSDQTSALVDTLPQVTQKLRLLIEGRDGSVSTIAKVQAAATEIEAVAEDMAAVASAPSPSKETPRKVARSPGTTPGNASRVVVEKPHFDIRAYMLSGTLGVLGVLSQVAAAFLVALFMLASGDAFRRKIVKFAGPTLTQKKVTLETLNEISRQIQRYLQQQLAVSMLVGLCTWLAFLLLGLNEAAAWGVVAALTNLIPYVGAMLVASGSALVGLVQFGSFEMALAVGAVSFVIHALIGSVLTPWWMGRANRMSALVVFIAVLAFGWLWGIPGLLLGVPILMVVKSICDHIDELKPVGELLSA